MLFWLPLLRFVINARNKITIKIFYFIFRISELATFGAREVVSRPLNLINFNSSLPLFFMPKEIRTVRQFAGHKGSEN